MSFRAPLPRTADDLLASYYNYERYYSTTRISLRVLIPRIYSGQIIGQQGKIIQNISNFYHVTLQFSRCESSRQFKRLLVIRGKAEDCAMACTNCFELITTSFSNPTPSSIDFILPDLFIEHLKENKVFQEMAEETNTEIRIMSNFLPSSTERIVRISIPSCSKDHIQSFYQAVKMLAQQLEENFTLYMCAPDNKFYQQEEESELLFTDDDAHASEQVEEIYCELTTEAQQYLQME